MGAQEEPKRAIEFKNEVMLVWCLGERVGSIIAKNEEREKRTNSTWARSQERRCDIFKESVSV